MAVAGVTEEVVGVELATTADQPTLVEVVADLLNSEQFKQRIRWRRCRSTGSAGGGGDKRWG